MNTNKHPAFICVYLVLSLMLSTSNVFAADSLPGYVQIRKASLRSAPQAWATLVSTLKYGTRVTVLEVGDNWLKVKTGSNKQGYIHRSALTKKRVVVTGTKPTFKGSAESSDLVLAGKGFTKDIEEQFKKGDVPLNYSAVNRLERRGVGEKSLLAFKREGHLD